MIYPHHIISTHGFRTAVMKVHNMAKQAKHENCSVIGCTKQHTLLQGHPNSEDRSIEWNTFIFKGSFTATVNTFYLTALPTGASTTQECS